MDLVPGLSPWLHNAYFRVLAECGYIDWKENFEDFHARLRDIIMNREVPIELILEVDSLLMQLQAEQEEIVEDEVTEDQPESENDSNPNSDIEDVDISDAEIDIYD